MKGIKEIDVHWKSCCLGKRQRQTRLCPMIIWESFFGPLVCSRFYLKRKRKRWTDENHELLTRSTLPYRDVLGMASGQSCSCVLHHLKR